jgi:hypothetical protein
VSVSVGDVAETVDGLPGCEIAPRDAAALAAAVRRTLTTKRSSALRDRALATSRPRTAQRVATVYEEVLAR